MEMHQVKNTIAKIKNFLNELNKTEGKEINLMIG